MHLTIRHVTTYRFDSPATSGLQQLRKTPKTSHHQRVVQWATHIEGGKPEATFEDHHNNRVELISFDKGAETLVITCEGVVASQQGNGVLGRHIGPAPLWLYQRQTDRTRAGDRVAALLRGLDPGEDLDRLHGLMQAVHGAVGYLIGASEPEWGAEDALKAGQGVCQDHAHVFLSCAREMGFPARYVSGYLMLDDRTDQDAMHAWAEAHVDGLGWVGFDVSNGISPDSRYVRVATGLDYSDAAPVTGLRIGGDGEALTVQIEVVQQ